ncbi:hypothetical protein F5Y15DRAFT_80451 [Xylariaceae sp. FL0016]|nr:hypothetical protein F5Y15DRAFT_80451 [Xylariaceae sp. FL0016]
MIWAGQMMLDHFGYKDAADGMMSAIETVLAKGDLEIVTADMGGRGTTRSLGEAIENEIFALGKH